MSKAFLRGVLVLLFSAGLVTVRAYDRDHDHDVTLAVTMGWLSDVKSSGNVCPPPV